MVNLAGSGSNSFASLLAVLNTYSIWKGSSLEDEFHVAYDLLAGSSGWDTAAIGLAATAGIFSFTPGLLMMGAAGITGSVISNIFANELWNSGMEPYKTDSNLLPFSLFNPNKATPSLILDSIKKNHYPPFRNGL